MSIKRKYWSSIKDDKFYTLTKDEQINFLHSHGLYIEYNVFSSSELIIKKGVLHLPKYSKEIKPSEDLINVFYEFVIEKYQYEIDKYFYLFFKEFNDVVFGKELILQKNFAVENFKTIYDDLNLKFDLLRKETSENNIENILQSDRFQILYGVRNGMKSKLAAFESLIAYLGGNEKYFDSSKFYETDDFQIVLKFEKYLKVLVSLNDRYQIIEDDYFNNTGKLKARYELYKGIFSTFEVFNFTDNYIKKLNENKPSKIDSLHQALTELDLISKSKKAFMDFIITEYKIPVIKIRNYPRDVNRDHDFRVKKIKEDLLNLPAEKS
ncbi:hypothetical protein [Polaribacter marinivivus]|uniref:Uncharacterized protein n=1 Tax=Polaribacter marinivivus TaxID=1524260 RepID=A0ABV8R7Z3_9FLAO